MHLRVTRDEQGRPVSVHAINTLTAIIKPPRNIGNGDVAISVAQLLPAPRHACPAAISSQILVYNGSANIPHTDEGRLAHPTSAHHLVNFEMLYTQPDHLSGIAIPMQCPAHEQGISSQDAAEFGVQSYVTGSGTFQAEMTLVLQRLHSNQAVHGTGDQERQLLCVFHLIPWYAKVWLHTLSLWVDGQVCGYGHITHSHHAMPKQPQSPLQELAHVR